MSIIEQLGGYEKAKSQLNDFNEGFGYWQDLNQALLDYRRQNNIFEVGDKVVFINQNMSSSIKTIKEILNDTHVSFNFHGFHVELIRHATEAEIQAGKRL